MTITTCLQCMKDFGECQCPPLSVMTHLKVSHDTITYPVSITREHLTEDEEEVVRDKYGRDADEVYEDYKEIMMN